MKQLVQLKLSVVFLFICWGLEAGAEEHIVSAQSTKYVPMVTFIQPGESVVWTNMVGHDTQSVEGLIPGGAESFHLAMGQNGSVTFDVEGVYIYKCNPHYSLGMVGSVVVGEPRNLDAVMNNAKGMSKRVAIKTKKALEKLSSL